MGAVVLESFEDLVELEVEGGVMRCLAPLIRDVQVRAVPSEDVDALPLVIFCRLVRRGLAFHSPRVFPMDRRSLIIPHMVLTNDQLETRAVL